VKPARLGAYPLSTLLNERVKRWDPDGGHRSPGCTVVDGGWDPDSAKREGKDASFFFVCLECPECPECDPHIAQFRCL